ncbi:MAG: NAD(P)H-dependent oxidoreductase subunit E [Candidatus Gracilibacteria bacterium]|nr:NAD(P)H-dependent oxidoreductase subunit E [Candidatus Gracilibacteria bacterium]
MKIKVCTGKTCTDRFSQYITTRLLNDKAKFNLEHLEIEDCMCMGHCKSGPNIMVDGNVKNYTNPAKASEHALNHKKKKK